MKYSLAFYANNSIVRSITFKVYDLFVSILIIFHEISRIIVNNFVILVTSCSKTRFLGKGSIKVQNHKGQDDERFCKY